MNSRSSHGSSSSDSDNDNDNNWLDAFGAIRQSFGHRQGQESEQLSMARPVSLSSTAMSGRTSILGSINSESGGQFDQSTLLGRSPTGVEGSRLSEFYEAYYRNSHIGPAVSAESSEHTLDRQLSIKKGDSPILSPLFSKAPGAAF